MAADPLSVAASIAGIISLADSVSRLTFRYVKAVKNAERDVQNLLGEVKSLADILRTLPAAALRLENAPFTATENKDLLCDLSRH